MLIVHPNMVWWWGLQLLTPKKHAWLSRPYGRTTILRINSAKWLVNYFGFNADFSSTAKHGFTACF